MTDTTSTESTYTKYRLGEDAWIDHAHYRSLEDLLPADAPPDAGCLEVLVEDATGRVLGRRGRHPGHARLEEGSLPEYVLAQLHGCCAAHGKFCRWCRPAPANEHVRHVLMRYVGQVGTDHLFEAKLASERRRHVVYVGLVSARLGMLAKRPIDGIRAVPLGIARKVVRERITDFLVLGDDAAHLEINFQMRAAPSRTSGLRDPAPGHAPKLPPSPREA